jgi:PAS domain S-box-containing protein
MGRHDRAVPAPEVEHYLKEELYRLIRQDPRIFEFIDQGSLDGIWYWDIEHPENEWYSPGFCALFGYREGEFPPTSAWWQQNIHPDDLALTLANFKKHEADPRVPYDQVVRYRHRDGSTVWVRCRGLLIRDEAGKPIRMLGAHTDLTDLKRTEAALRQSEERYRTLATASPVGMFRTDAEGRCTYVNERWCEISGLSPEQALGEGWGRRWTPGIARASRCSGRRRRPGKRHSVWNIAFVARAMPMEPSPGCSGRPLPSETVVATCVAMLVPTRMSPTASGQRSRRDSISRRSLTCRA